MDYAKLTQAAATQTSQQTLPNYFNPDLHHLAVPLVCRAQSIKPDQSVDMHLFHTHKHVLETNVPSLVHLPSETDLNKYDPKNK